MKKQELVSLSDVAQSAQLNKSRLAYYAKLGLLKDAYVDTVSKTQIYDKEKLLRVLKEVDDFQEHGDSLQDIVKKFRDEN